MPSLPPLVPSTCSLCCTTRASSLFSNTPGTSFTQAVTSSARCLLLFFEPLLKRQLCSKSWIRSCPFLKPPSLITQHTPPSHPTEAPWGRVLGSGPFCCPQCLSPGGKGLQCSSHRQRQGPVSALGSASPFTRKATFNNQRMPDRPCPTADLSHVRWRWQQRLLCLRAPVQPAAPIGPPFPAPISLPVETTTPTPAARMV